MSPNAPILVAERDDSTLDVVVGALRAAGFVPEVARNVESALDAVGRIVPVAAVIGEGLGRRDSQRLCRALSNRTDQPLPVLLIAAPGSLRPHAASELEPPEADEIITRPLNVEGLIEKLCAAIEAHEARRGSPEARLEDATREAASAALEEAIARDDKLWAAAREHEEARYGRRPADAVEADSTPSEAIEGRGRLGALADRLLLLQWLARSRATARLTCSGDVKLDWKRGTPIVTTLDDERALRRFFLLESGEWHLSSGLDRESSTSLALEDLLWRWLPEILSAEILLTAAEAPETHPRALLPLAALRPAEAEAFFELLDGRRSLRTAAEESGLGPARAATAALIAHAAGALGGPEPREAARIRAAPSRAASSVVLESGVRRKISAPALHVRELWHIARTQDYFTILGIPITADRDRVEAAYEQTRASLDVDVIRHDAELSMMAEEVERVLEEARAVLSAPGLRAAYRANMVPRASKSEA